MSIDVLFTEIKKLNHDFSNGWHSLVCCCVWTYCYVLSDLSVLMLSFFCKNLCPLDPLQGAWKDSDSLDRKKVGQREQKYATENLVSNETKQEERGNRQKQRRVEDGSKWAINEFTYFVADKHGYRHTKNKLLLHFYKCRCPTTSSCSNSRVWGGHNRKSL
jgi:hypothetical protein